MSRKVTVSAAYIRSRLRPFVNMSHRKICFDVLYNTSRFLLFSFILFFSVLRNSDFFHCFFLKQNIPTIIVFRMFFFFVIIIISTKHFFLCKQVALMQLVAGMCQNSCCNFLCVGVLVFMFVIFLQHNGSNLSFGIYSPRDYNQVLNNTLCKLGNSRRLNTFFSQCSL